MKRERYQRHYSLSEIGPSGQERLANAKVVIVGIGGLGCPLAQLLNAAGIGQLMLVDGDKVEESNLARQLLYGPDSIGRWKVEVAKEQLQKWNPTTQISIAKAYVDHSNAAGFLEGADLVVDCSDNYLLRYTLSDSSSELEIPMIYAALYKWEGQVSVLNFRGGPSYRNIYPDQEALANLPSCSEVGVVSSLPSIIAGIQATEAIKLLLDLPHVLSGKLLNYNALSGKFYTVEIHEEQER